MLPSSDSKHPEERLHVTPLRRNSDPYRIYATEWTRYLLPPTRPDHLLLDGGEWITVASLLASLLIHADIVIQALALLMLVCLGYAIYIACQYSRSLVAPICYRLLLIGVGIVLAVV